MKNADVELIQRVIDGDDTAFSELVKKYEKTVHALAWQRIQDFHIAQDITQETFLKAYQELSTLKEPQSFSSWLYVIVINKCNTWLRKKRLPTQSLEDTDSAELESQAYSKHIIDEKERENAETRREVVKKLLSNLPEIDRTVVTLHYLGGMTYEEISKFLGVSVSSIKNRLYRVRQHLKKEEQKIREALENYHMTPRLTEEIMRKIERIEPAVPTAGNPFIPWVLAISSIVLFGLLHGIGIQYSPNSQKAYNLEAQTDMVVQLVNSRVVTNLEVKPDIHNTRENSKIIGHINNTGQKLNPVFLDVTSPSDKSISALKENTLDLEMILEGIKQNDEAVKSGEGECIYSQEIYPKSGLGHPTTMTWKAHLVFDQHQNRVRMELEESISSDKIHLPKRTTTVTNTGTLDLVYHDENLIPNYYFLTDTILRPFWMYTAPRRWMRIVNTQDLSTSLKQFNYKILTYDIVGGIPCCVLEAKDYPLPGTSRIWIAYEHGFRMLKHELKPTRKVDSLDGSLKQGTSTVTRFSLAYEQFGDVWFLKSAKQENTWIDSGGKEHVTFLRTLELRNFMINHPVPPPTFTVEIPEDSMITVQALRRRMSKKEFFEQYEQK